MFWFVIRFRQKASRCSNSGPNSKSSSCKQKTAEADLLPLVKDVHAMVVRSETKITKNVIAAAPNLRVVGRAGVGVDNVDVEAATATGHRGHEHARRQHHLHGGTDLFHAHGAGAQDSPGPCSP